MNSSSVSSPEETSSKDEKSHLYILNIGVCHNGDFKMTNPILENVTREFIDASYSCNISQVWTGHADIISNQEHCYVQGW